MTYPNGPWTSSGSSDAPQPPYGGPGSGRHPSGPLPPVDPWQTPGPRRPRRGWFRNPAVIAAALVVLALAAFGAYAGFSRSAPAARTSATPSTTPTVASTPPSPAVRPSIRLRPASSDPSGQGPLTSLPGFTLRYTQEFKGNSLPRGWEPYNGVPGGESASMAQWEPSMCSVSGGEARFMADGVDSCGMEFIGAPQEYGAYFARIKGDLEPSSMSFSDIFLLWPDNSDWPPEIDIYEDNGGNRNLTYASMYNTVGTTCGPQSDPSQNCLQNYEQTNRPVGVSNNGTQWHTYGVEWTPSGVTWLIDGKVIYRAPASAVKSPAQQPAQDMDMVLQSQNLQGAGAPSQRETMTVDWVEQFRYNG